MTSLIKAFSPTARNFSETIRIKLLIEAVVAVYW